MEKVQRDPERVALSPTDVVKAAVPALKIRNPVVGLVSFCEVLHPTCVASAFRVSRYT